MKVRLEAKTRKGKQRIKQHGAEGEVLRITDDVIFSTDKGPWLLVNAADPVSRWVHRTHDKDFRVHVVELCL